MTKLIYGIGLTLAALAVSISPRPSFADSLDLGREAQVTSTVPANGDVNPYGVAFVPSEFHKGGTISPGDVLVSNFNNVKNLQGTGTTIVKFTPSRNGPVAPNGSAAVFFQGAPGLGLTTALGVLRRGFVIVGNTPTTDGTFATIQPGSLLFLDKSGNLLSQYTAVDGPWDLTVVDFDDHAIVFLSNVLNGTVTRLLLHVGPSGVTVHNQTTIATGYPFRSDSAALVVGPTGLAYKQSDDSLFVASTADNSIYRIPHAALRTSAVNKGVLVSQDNHLRGPLALARTDDVLIAANGDAVNGDVTQPSEIVHLSIQGHFLGQSNIDPAQGGAFGLALQFGSNAPKALAYVDDNASSLTVLSLDNSGK